MKRGPGRYSKLTPEVQKQLCDYIRLGNTLQDAALKVGLGPSTVFRWLSLAREARPRREFREFLEAIDKAQADYRISANAQMLTHGKRHWQALAWFLERTQPKAYGLRIRVHVNEELEQMLNKLQQRLTPEEYERALEALSAPDDSAPAIDEAPGLASRGGPGVAAGVGAAVESALSGAASPGEADGED